MKSFVRFSQMILLTLAAVFFLLCGAWLAFGWMSGSDGASALRERGVETTGEVVAVTKSAGTITKYGHAQAPTYHVRYRFIDGTGLPHEAMTTTRGDLNAFRVGDAIEIRYVPDRPEISMRVQRGEPLGTPLAMIVLCFGGGLICATGAGAAVLERPAGAKARA